MSEPLTAILTFKAASLQAAASRLQNNFKGGMSVMAYAKGSSAAAGCVVNIYGSSSKGVPQGTGQQGDGNWALVDDVTKQTLVATLHPTTTTTGATGVNAVLPNVVCFWDYLFVEVTSLEGGTNQIEVVLSGADNR